MKYPLADGSLAAEMISVPGGTFIRVDDTGEPVSEVELSDYTLGRYVVTFEQYDRFAKATERKLPGACGWGRGSRPIMKISWHDATAYTQWLSDSTGENFRLPTEAQWEYACRAGTMTDYSFGQNITEGQVNFNKIENKTMPVGSYRPNQLGIYEMHGNVWEWCSDWYGKYPLGKVSDPKGPDNGEMRVLRGGSWFVNAWYTRSQSRACDQPEERDHSRGFRLAGG